MKNLVVILLFVIGSFSFRAEAQCSICAKTAQQMGEKPAKGFNSGIIYLMIVPFGVMGYIGYKWWKTQQ